MFNYQSHLIPKNLIICSLIFLLSSCVTPSSGTGPAKDLDIKSDYKYAVGSITVPAQAVYEIDAASLLGDALQTSLKEKNLLVENVDTVNVYTINARILDYQMGNAFKRWLLPGYGSTILSVHTEIIDPGNNEIASEMEHRQMIGSGGLYSAGAWEGIFATIANDIVIDIDRKYSGEGEDFIVNLDPWLENETSEVPKSLVLQSIYVMPFEDLRDQKFRIGERHAAFNVSMGSVYANREVTAYLTEAIKNELLASGNRILLQPSDINISGEVTKFWVWTDTSLTHWDVIGELEVTLTAQCPNSDRTLTRIYTAGATERTYVWPSETLVSEVLANTVNSLMMDIRQDSIWAQLN